MKSEWLKLNVRVSLSPLSHKQSTDQSRLLTMNDVTADPQCPQYLVPVLQYTSRQRGEATPLPALGGLGSRKNTQTIGFFRGLGFSWLETKNTEHSQVGHLQKGFTGCERRENFPFIPIRLEERETRKILSKCCKSLSQVYSYWGPWHPCYDTSSLTCQRMKTKELIIATLEMM